MMATKENPYHIEIIGRAIGHAAVIEVPWSPFINIDFTRGNIFEITLKGNATLLASRMLGGRFSIIIKQDYIGGHTLSFGPEFKFSEGDDGLISAEISSINILDCVNDPETRYIYTTVSPHYVNL